MELYKKYQKISASPTRPNLNQKKKKFDMDDLFRGPLPTDSNVREETQTSLDEKLRKAYFWIVNYAIISPYYDIEYNSGPHHSYTVGDLKTVVNFPSAQSYSSYVLFPLLTLATRRRCLLVGGPGRGKTASAILMGVMSGYSLKEVKRSIQHGQPQMTISDLLGNPIPSDLMNAKNMDEIKIAWRKWLGMRVKIIDEYNRIPTRTQSALLTVLGDNYAEILDQIYECPDAAWYLTANDDAGGGTYEVIEALKDRLDIVVKALHFNTRFLGELLKRLEDGMKPEEVVPAEVIFTEEELNEMNSAILSVEFPDDLLRQLEFFASHFEFLDVAGEQIEYKTKDTLKLSGLDYRAFSSTDSGKDKNKDIGSQTKNGLSVRALMTCIVYMKAMAYFRGNEKVEYEDVRQVLPFVLHDKLVQNPDSPFFEIPGNQIYRSDKVSWIRKLLELSNELFISLGLDSNDPIFALEEEFKSGLEGLSMADTKKRMTKIEKLMNEWTKTKKLYGHQFDDILKLKYLHQRYTNYMEWLKWQSG
ncbi:MAG: AAA family ATPase [Leptospiraceae bacterium]|nr:AAA family ATPase [Leptospiraceae bacterium]MCP5511902.1 AAA family ATPase [Leptospiraceae bacterium]